MDGNSGKPGTFGVNDSCGAWIEVKAEADFR